MNLQKLPEVEQVAEYVWAIPHSLPEDHPDYVLTYVVLDKAGDVHVIDPGWDSEDNVAGLNSGLAGLGRRPEDVCSVTLTHQHKDHSGLSEYLRSASGCPIAVHPEDQQEMLFDVLPLAQSLRLERMGQWEVSEDYREELLLELSTQTPNVPPSLKADLLLEEGDYLLIPGRNLKVHHTPGHTPGHICIEDLDSKLVFTGDHIIGEFNPGVGLGKMWKPDSMLKYIDSVKKISSIQGTSGLPGHGPMIADLPARCLEISEHHENRIREVANILEMGSAASTWEIAQALTWAKSWDSMHPTIRRMVLSQTEMYVYAIQHGK